MYSAYFRPFPKMSALAGPGVAGVWVADAAGAQPPLPRPGRRLRGSPERLGGPPAARRPHAELLPVGDPQVPLPTPGPDPHSPERSTRKMDDAGQGIESCSRSNWVCRFMPRLHNKLQWLPTSFPGYGPIFCSYFPKKLTSHCPSRAFPHLLFDDSSNLPLDEWVLTTEAHPLRRRNTLYREDPFP